MNTLHGPHNMRHTFARRLAMAGVPLEARKALMHHINGDITLHCSPVKLRELYQAVGCLKQTEKRRGYGLLVSDIYRAR